MPVLYKYRKRTSALASDLRAAIELGNYAAVKQCITRNRRLTNCRIGRAADHPVHLAAQSGHQHIVRLLLNRGANPNARNKHMMTPAHLCVLHCRHEVVELLIQHGADPAATDSADNTPLDLATLLNEMYVMYTCFHKFQQYYICNRVIFYVYGVGLGVMFMLYIYRMYILNVVGTVGCFYTIVLRLLW